MFPFLKLTDPQSFFREVDTTQPFYAIDSEENIDLTGEDLVKQNRIKLIKLVFSILTLHSYIGCV